jgi:hypothetical protein
MLLALSITLSADGPADTVVVCPKPYLQALQPWIVHRRGRGHRLQIISEPRTAEELRESIRDTARGGALRYVLLVGDAPPHAEIANGAAQSDRWVPTHAVPAKVNVAWGSEPEIATDSPYADLDDDGLPDVAVGRLTADSEAELRRMVQKILAYEASTDWGPWRRRVSLIAGVGGFGTVTDAVVEMAAKKFLTDGIPAGFHTTMTYGSWQSPYCPDPRLFHQLTLYRLNEGCLFWIYIGHGRQRHLDWMQVPGGAFPILDSDDMREVQSRHGFPIAILLACYAGAFDQPVDCLAEEMLRSSGGPVAVLCGSRVTMPYGMSTLSVAMMDEYFRHRPATLGELLLQAKRRMAAADQATPQRQLLDALAAALSPGGGQLAEERLEHVSLMNLLGDPLLRLQHPEAIDLQTAATVDAGQPLKITGRCQSLGSGAIELVCRRDRARVALPVRGRFAPTHEFLASFNDAYREVNDPVWSWRPWTSQGGEFAVELEVPPDAAGPCHVRAFVSNGTGCALGAADVFVRRMKELVAQEAGPPPVAEPSRTATAPSSSAPASLRR